MLLVQWDRYLIPQNVFPVKTELFDIACSECEYSALCLSLCASDLLVTYGAV